MAKDSSKKRKAMGSLVNNFRFGMGTNKFDEEFLNYCIGRIAELDHRSKRFVMCSLISEALHEGRYSEITAKIEQEYNGARSASFRSK